jgi:hypothetical protein
VGKADLKELGEMLRKIGEQLAKQDINVQRIGKGMQEYGNELRNNLRYAQDIEDSTRKLSEAQKTVLKNMVKTRDLKGVRDILKEMQDINRKQANQGLWSKEQTKRIKSNAKEIEAALKEVRNMSQEAFDGKRVEDLQKRITRLTKDSQKLSSTMRGVRYSSRSTDVHATTQAVSHLFQLHRTRAGQVARSTFSDVKHYARMGAEIRDAQKERREGNIEAFRKRRRDIYNKAKSSLKDSFQGMPDDRKRFMKDPRRIRTHVEQQARNSGMGKFQSRILAEHYANESSGQKNSFLTNTAVKLMARGEGSLGAGAVGLASDAVAGGAGALAEAAGIGAVPLAIGSVIKMAFDHNQARNSDVAERLGGSGIYAPGRDPLDSIANVRRNLTGPFYSSFGVGYEKNMQIAQAMSNAGFSNANLSGHRLSQDRDGILEGSFGSMQRNVYAYGKMAGIDPSQTMEQTLKLISQYKMSLGSTEEFFQGINKDIRAAGLSSVKWLQLLDLGSCAEPRPKKLFGDRVRFGYYPLRERISRDVKGQSWQPLWMYKATSPRQIQHPSKTGQSPTVRFLSRAFWASIPAGSRIQRIGYTPPGSRYTSSSLRRPSCRAAPRNCLAGRPVFLLGSPT